MSPRSNQHDPHGAPRRSNNVAARMGRWSSGHRKTAIFGWLAFVIAAFAIAAAMPMKTIDQSEAGVGESRKADKILQSAFPQEKDGLGEFVVIQSNTLTV